MDTVEVKSASDVTFANAFDTEKLFVQSNSKANLVEGSTFENLVVEVSDDIMNSEVFDLGVVLSGLSYIDFGKVSVLNANGDAYQGSLAYTYTPQVPEPATYAIIFGALVLGFVMYRRRK